MRFEKLAEAINLVNQTGYGLTAGLESLDDREQEQWQAGLRAGNLYLNRVTTGAVVLRQPFGGLGKSAFGPGIKAGGPNYVAQFMEFTDTGELAADEPPADPLLRALCEQLRRLDHAGRALPPDQLQRILAAASSYAASFRAEFGQSHDDFKLVGQDNFRRYLAVRELRVRVHPQDTPFEVFARVAAARTVGCRITVSYPPAHDSAALKLLEELTESWAGAIELLEETDDQLAEIIRERQTDRIRYAAPGRVAAVALEAAAETGLYIASQPVLVEGRLELLWYVQEQSLSFDYHRYGNLGVRAGEVRAGVL
jgi:RHH-type proline utilization regulon transcriptional repressor/proline dehydrogenase/delta 1-pyrroline-5-carboxylate dehydrogenase